MAAVAKVAAGSEAPSTYEWNGTMLNTISNSPSLIMPVKALWDRLVDSLANRLEERRAQAEVAMMTPCERMDVDVMHGNLTGSEFACTTQRNSPTGN